MGKASRKKKLIKAQQSGLPEKKSSTKPKKFPLWKGLVTSLVAVIVFIVLIVGVLVLSSRKSELQKEDASDFPDTISQKQGDIKTAMQNYRIALEKASHRR